MCSVFYEVVLISNVHKKCFCHSKMNRYFGCWINLNAHNMFWHLPMLRTVFWVKLSGNESNQLLIIIYVLFDASYSMFKFRSCSLFFHTPSISLHASSGYLCEAYKHFLLHGQFTSHVTQPLSLFYWWRKRILGP